MSTEKPEQSVIQRMLEDGATNAAIARHTGVSLRTVARIRREAGLPDAARSAWVRSEHPKCAEIQQLLGDGHTDAEIRRRTGADVSTVARIRKAGGYGPATIVRRGTRVHPQDARIRELISQGLSNAKVAQETGADRSAVRRIRGEMGVALPPAQPLSLEEKWQQRTRPVEGGHLEWTGERASTSRTPVTRYRGQTLTAASIAFRQRTGRDPVGQVKAECEMRQCVAPAHVEDEPGRTRLREQLRMLLGMGERPKECRRHHDQSKHGRLQPDGVAYCQLCHQSGRTRSEVTQ